MISGFLADIFSAVLEWALEGEGCGWVTGKRSNGENSSIGSVLGIGEGLEEVELADGVKRQKGFPWYYR